MMANALEAFKTLITEVKDSFGTHGELSNPDHPLAKPVADAEAVVKEMEELTADRPTTPEVTEVLNPSDLKVTIEDAGAEGRTLTFRFDDDGVTVESIDAKQEPAVVSLTRRMTWAEFVAEQQQLEFAD